MTGVMPSSCIARTESEDQHWTHDLNAVTVLNRTGGWIYMVTAYRYIGNTQNKPSGRHAINLDLSHIVWDLQYYETLKSAHISILTIENPALVKGLTSPIYCPQEQRNEQDREPIHDAAPKTTRLRKRHPLLPCRLPLRQASLPLWAWPSYR